MTFPGPKCAICCTIFSGWGVITLLIIGICYNSGYRRIDNHAVENAKTAATNSYIAAVIYFAFVLGCFARFFWLKIQEKRRQRLEFTFTEQFPL